MRIPQDIVTQEKRQAMIVQSEKIINSYKPPKLDLKIAYDQDEYVAQNISQKIYKAIVKILKDEGGREDER